MPRQYQTAVMKSFLKGRISEASPLNFPEDALLDERNFVLNRDGSADRRLGMDYETSHALRDTSATTTTWEDWAYTTFEWEGAGGDSGKDIIVLQFGNELFFHDTHTTPLSSTSSYITKLNTQGDNATEVTYANVDGDLYVATGAKLIDVFKWNGTTVTQSTVTLQIRDLFGVADTFGTRDLHAPEHLAFRPTGLTDTHLYNLRNQTWGPVIANDQRTNYDPVDWFYKEDNYSRYPSNADNVATGIVTQSEFTPPSEAFSAQALHDNDPFNVAAPKGFFVIDALERGGSRDSQFRQHFANSTGRALVPGNNAPRDLSRTFVTGTPLPTDRTPGGARVVIAFAGRLFYAGFSGQVEGGDNRSPQMSGYILFSPIIDHPTQAGQCYQEGDPTSRETPDLVASDGGFIHIGDAVGIEAGIVSGERLYLFGKNGVWMIRGQDGQGFRADAFEQTKLSEIGTDFPRSVVEANGSVFYWTEDGIYAITLNQFGEAEVQNLTRLSIQSFFSSIPEAEKVSVRGKFDRFEGRVRWLYGEKTNTATDSGKELVFDIESVGFFTSVINKPTAGSWPVLLDYVEVGAYSVGSFTEDVTDTGGTVVTDTSGNAVTVSRETRNTGNRSLLYFSLGTPPGSTVQYTFSLYNQPDFLDWKTVDSTGVDATAYIEPGYITGGDVGRIKKAPTVVFHFKRTEDGFELDSNGDIVFSNPSGCTAQYRWDWSDSNSSNRWTSPAQVYRYGRYHIPASVSDPLDYGFSTIVTRNKVRGKGRTLTVRLATEAGKDCRVQGWQMLLGAEETM